MDNLQQHHDPHLLPSSTNDEDIIQKPLDDDLPWYALRLFTLKTQQVIDYLEAVSYTHLTLPTTPYV